MTDPFPLDRIYADAILFALKAGLRANPTDETFNLLLDLYGHLSQWAAGRRGSGQAAALEKKRRQAMAKPIAEAIADEEAEVIDEDDAAGATEEEPEPPPPEPVQKVSLATALKWYSVREGRGVKAMGGGAFQIEARDDILNIRQLMSVINQSRRRADQPKFDLKE